MKLRQVLESNTTQRVGGLALSLLIRFWMRTVNYRVCRYDATVDPILTEFRGPVLFLLWHEYVLIPFYLRRFARLGILASRHRDAESLSQMALMNGFQVFRGSSGRGGVGVLKTLLNQPENSGLVITPDGPRGPRREMAAGAIFLASKLQMPLVPVGLGMERPWRNQRSWDKFAIPRAGSNARAIIGPRINIPAELKRDELEHYRQSVQRSLLALTVAAEEWAHDGRPRLGAGPALFG